MTKISPFKKVRQFVEATLRFPSCEVGCLDGITQEQFDDIAAAGERLSEVFADWARELDRCDSALEEGLKKIASLLKEADAFERDM